MQCDTQQLLWVTVNNRQLLTCGCSLGFSYVTKAHTCSDHNLDNSQIPRIPSEYLSQGRTQPAPQVPGRHKTCISCTARRPAGWPYKEALPVWLGTLMMLQTALVTAGRHMQHHLRSWPQQQLDTDITDSSTLRSVRLLSK
jgi:hypothetical protein